LTASSVAYSRSL